MPVQVDDAAFDLSRIAELFPAAVTLTRTSQEDFGSASARHLAGHFDGREDRRYLHRRAERRHALQLFFEVINHAGRATYVCTLLFGIGPST